MTYGTRSGQLPVPPPSVRTGEVYADEGTLILDPASAYVPEPPASYGYPPPPPSSVRPPASSWTDLRGNWVVPAPPSSRTAAPQTSRNDRGVIAAMGIGGLAVLAAFAAALLAFSDETPGARGREHATHGTAAAAPLAATSLPLKVAMTTSFAPAPPPQAVAAAPAPAPVLEVGDDSVPTVSAPAPAAARVVAPATPKSAPSVAAAAQAVAPKPAVVAAAAPAPTAKKKAAPPKAGGKSQQEILEDLLEQQLAR